MEYTIEWPLGVDGKDRLGVGISATVARLDAVVKFVRPQNKPDIDREAQVYQRLGCDHNGILRYYDRIGNALILQHACHGSIRRYFRIEKQSASPSLCRRWIKQIASAMSFVHSQKILHGDISCNNVFLDENLDVKLGDFAGSSIDGKPSLVCYETSHDNPNIEDISTQSELFALGSTFFEIMTGQRPYEGWPDREVEDAYRNGKFPDTSSLYHIAI